MCKRTAGVSRLVSSVITSRLTPAVHQENPMPRLLLIAGLLAALGATGCRARVQPGGASGSKPEAARKQAETLAVNAVTGAAEAQVRADPSLARRRGLGGLVDKVVVIGTAAAEQVTSKIGATGPPVPEPAETTPSGSQAAAKEAPQPKSLPRPGPPPVIKERVVSTLAHPSEAEAEADAKNVACDLIAQQLAALDPPVKYRPTPNEVEKEFARRDSRTVRPLNQAEKEFFEKNGITGNLVRVEFDVEVTPHQVRELRTRERVAGTLRLFGGLTAVALAAFLFLRLDEWTKGYLTRWLAVAAVLFAGGTAAALYFV
jgi:hypothetical protein